MRRTICLCAIFLFTIVTWGQDLSFGKITITPYIPKDVGLDEATTKLLNTKLSQIVNVNDAVGGFDRRFLIVPSVNVLSEAETATIPKKTTVKVNVTFYIGDGVAGTLYNSQGIEISGVGDNHDEAIYSAIKKINVRNAELQSQIKEAKGRIVDYYDSTAPMLIEKAEGYMAAFKYEDALLCLGSIPSICKHYEKTQVLISKCGGKIIERENDSLLAKAKMAWSSNPNKEGASEAYAYLSQIIISSNYYKNAIDKLSSNIRQRLIQIEDNKLELKKMEMLSEERLETERTKASADVTSAFINTLPSIVFNVLRWF
jgi:hypothetical protein